MSEKPEEDFEDGESGDIIDGGEDLDIDGMMRDLDRQKRRGRSGGHQADPAWRKLERFLDDQHTHDLLSDFDDYDIRSDEDEPPPPPRHGAKSRKRA